MRRLLSAVPHVWAGIDGDAWDRERDNLHLHDEIHAPFHVPLGQCYADRHLGIGVQAIALDPVVVPVLLVALLVQHMGAGGRGGAQGPSEQAAQEYEAVLHGEAGGLAMLPNPYGTSVSSFKEPSIACSTTVATAPQHFKSCSPHAPAGSHPGLNARLAGPWILCHLHPQLPACLPAPGHGFRYRSDRRFRESSITAPFPVPRKQLPTLS